jgi:hypothetical protein
VALARSTIKATIVSRAEVIPRGVASSQGSSTATPPNSAIEADVALAALGTTQLNARRYADRMDRVAIRRSVDIHEPRVSASPRVALFRRLRGGP